MVHAVDCLVNWEQISGECPENSWDLSAVVIFANDMSSGTFYDSLRTFGADTTDLRPPKSMINDRSSQNLLLCRRNCQISWNSVCAFG